MIDEPTAGKLARMERTRVLVVEGNELLRSTMAQLLSLAGFDFDATTTSCDDALMLLVAMVMLRPTIALVDVHLRGARAFIARLHRLGTPVGVIGMTTFPAGVAPGGVSEDDFAADVWLVKPFTYEQFTEALRRAVAAARGTHSGGLVAAT